MVSIPSILQNYIQINMGNWLLSKKGLIDLDRQDGIHTNFELQYILIMSKFLTLYKEIYGMVFLRFSKFLQAV